MENFREATLFLKCGANHSRPRHVKGGMVANAVPPSLCVCLHVSVCRLVLRRSTERRFDEMPGMLNYLLGHPELTFSPPETADLCEAFDLAVAELQERDGNATNWAADDVRTTLAAEIVRAWSRGEKDIRRLSDQAVRMADTMCAGGPKT
jgi:hypothetical protein